MMICNFKQLRTDLGLTQMELATQSGISLPTIQNIESGKANPSIEILTRVLNVLGLEIKVSVPGFQAESAVLLGVPLSANHSTTLMKPSRSLLLSEARKWTHYFKENVFSEREALAITSFLCALKDYWPSIYSQIECPIFNKLISISRNNGHCIKLRRIAIANLSSYL
jgi:transcriptional regulator with XRE-family HTH domain